MEPTMKVIDKEELYKSGVRFPNEVCSPWDMIKAIEWAMADHIRRFHMSEDVNDKEQEQA
jgi:hypothetical protein